MAKKAKKEFITKAAGFLFSVIKESGLNPFRALSDKVEDLEDLVLELTEKVEKLQKKTK